MNIRQAQNAPCVVRCSDCGLASSRAGRQFEFITRHGGERRSPIMARTRLAGSVATAALVVAAMTSCASDGPEPVPSTITSSAPSVSSPAPSASTATTTPPSDSEMAAGAVADLLRTYFATVDQVRQDPTRPASDLDTVASSSQLTAQKNLLESQRADGLRQLGDTQVAEVSVESVNLDDPATVIVDVCWDVSAVDVVDSSGTSVVTPERRDSGWTRFTVTNLTWEAGSTDGWRVSGGSDLENEPCAGS